ncbi:MAG: hypothetical protein N4A45_12535 [Flavobacteriales bacterium]|jgi:hypothetical protein|nr:hypothetical protein [Flavobacteriales bacterium]
MNKTFLLILFSWVSLGISKAQVSATGSIIPRDNEDLIGFRLDVQVENLQFGGGLLAENNKKTHYHLNIGFKSSKGNKIHFGADFSVLFHKKYAYLFSDEIETRTKLGIWPYIDFYIAPVLYFKLSSGFFNDQNGMLIYPQIGLGINFGRATKK